MTVAQGGIDPQIYNPEYHPPGEPTHTFWIQATPGTSYWRCLIPAKELGAQAVKLVEQDFVPKKLYNQFGEAKGEDISIPKQKGSAVWQFPGNPTRGRIIGHMMAEGIRVLVESDDNYTIPNPGVPGVVQEWKTRQGKDKEHTSREVHVMICGMVDGIIVSTPWLKKFYEKYNDVYVCPNSVDPDDWPEPSKIDDKIFRIGYAYSSSHWYDLDLVLPALEWASQQKDVEVVMMGPIFFEKAVFRRFKFANVMWQASLEDYRRNLAILDVGLCPVVPGDWPNSRSDIKAMELAMSGSMAIMSPTESYKPWFDLNGDACLFPDGNRAKDWMRIVKEVVQNRDMVKDVAKSAREYVLSERTIAKNIHYWEKALEG